jgi:diaminopimelate epimerase
VTDRLLKVEGCGNDFIVGLGLWAGRLQEDAALVRRLCDRRRGIGADGVLALEPAPAGPDGIARLEVVYCNADGSRGAFCGNASRCAARVGAELLGLGQVLELVTDWALIRAEVHADRVALQLPRPEPPRRVRLEADGEPWELELCTLGVPHAVVDVGERLDGVDLARLGPRLGHHPGVGPEGCNVNLVRRLAPVSGESGPVERLAIRTWERGVEAETLACGSGSTVAALLFLGATGGRCVEVCTAGGDSLVIEALGQAPTCSCRLVGPARVLASIEPRDDLLR